jgi:hypothetical protein
VLRHERHGEVAREVRSREASERQQHERRLADRRCPPERHQDGIAPLRAPERNEGLNEREHQSQDQGELTNFRRHGLCGSRGPFGAW